MQDRCTLEGVSEGDLPPGVKPVGFKPLSTCFNSSDCSEDFRCKNSNKTICSCSPSTGTDACRAIGSCVMQPCTACGVCLQAMQLFPDIVKGTTSADAVADKFRAFCAGTGRNTLACEATAAAIAASVAGNLGRRVGALCRSLAECPETACNITTDVGQAPKPLDLCTIKGVASNSPQDTSPEVSGVITDLSCTKNADCTAEGNFCSMATPERVCSCSAATGVVSCEMRGSCKSTPCKVCSDCVASWQGHISGTSSGNSATVASAFQAACSSAAYPGVVCKSTTGFITSSNKGNLGLRAGAICSMLGECHS